MKKKVRVKVNDGIADVQKGLQFDYKGKTNYVYFPLFTQYLGSENTATILFTVVSGKKKADEEKLFEVEKTFNISPSKDPVSLQLIPCEDDAVDSESPLILKATVGSQRKWKINILSATKQIVTGLNGKLSVSWREDDTEIEASEEEISLPMLTLPQQAKGQHYTVSWQPEGKKKCIQLKFSVNLTPLPPYSMNLRFDDVSPEVQKVKCDMEYVLKIYLRDTFENQIGDPSPEDKRWLSKLTPQFSVVGKKNVVFLLCLLCVGDEPSAENVCTDVFKWCPENYWIGSVKIHSKKLGGASFTVVDPTNTLKSSSIPVHISEGIYSLYIYRVFTIIIGQVSQLRINGLDGVTVNGYKGYSLEEYTITSCDACGNLVKMNASLDFKTKKSKKPPMSVKKLSLVEGSCNLGAVLIDGAPGEYDIQVTCLTFKLNVRYLTICVFILMCIYRAVILHLELFLILENQVKSK